MRSHSSIVPTLVTAGDLLALLAAWAVAEQLAPPGFTPVLLLPLAVLHQLALSARGLHTQLRRASAGDLFRRVVAAWGRIAIAVVLTGFLLPEWMPKGAALVFVCAFLAALLAVRFLSMAVRRHVRQRGRNLRYLLIAGTGSTAMRAHRAITADKGLGLRIAGHLSADGRSQSTEPGPEHLLGRYDQLEEVVRRHVVDELLVADPDCSLGTITELVETGRVLGLRTHVVAGFLGSWRGVDARQINGDVVLHLMPNAHDVFGLSVKRALDVAVAATALVLLMPVFLGIAAAIVLGSPGPVFFTQWRIGLNGRRFRCPKFRSMRADAQAQLGELQPRNEMDGPVFKIRNDPRVTRVGRWLRRFSLDELPQLWCVLRGDMSLVGPRPLMPHEIDGHLAWQRRRLSVRPGLTCLWQVSGRNDLDFDRWIQLDLEYIDTWSLGLDLRILARTVPAVLSGRGAC